MKGEDSSRYRNVPGGQLHPSFQLPCSVPELFSWHATASPCGGGKYTHRCIFRGNALALSCVADEHVYINERYHRRVIFASGFLVSPLSLSRPSTLWQGLSLSIASTIVICAIANVADRYSRVTNDQFICYFPAR